MERRVGDGVGVGLGGWLVTQISIMNRYLLRNYLESVLKVSKFLRSLEVLSLGLKC